MKKLTNLIKYVQSYLVDKKKKVKQKKIYKGSSSTTNNVNMAIL